MKKTYEILLNGHLMDDYTMGCLTGIIYVGSEDIPVAVRFNATEEQVRTVVECINNLCPDIYAGVKVAE